MAPLPGAVGGDALGACPRRGHLRPVGRAGRRRGRAWRPGSRRATRACGAFTGLSGVSAGNWCAAWAPGTGCISPWRTGRTWATCGRGAWRLAELARASLGLGNRPAWDSRLAALPYNHLLQSWTLGRVQRPERLAGQPAGMGHGLRAGGRGASAAARRAGGAGAVCAERPGAGLGQPQPARPGAGFVGSAGAAGAGDPHQDRPGCRAVHRPARRRAAGGNRAGAAGRAGAARLGGLGRANPISKHRGAGFAWRRGRRAGRDAAEDTLQRAAGGA